MWPGPGRGRVRSRCPREPGPPFQLGGRSVRSEFQTDRQTDGAQAHTHLDEPTLHHPLRLQVSDNTHTPVSGCSFCFLHTRCVPHVCALLRTHWVQRVPGGPRSPRLGDNKQARQVSAQPSILRAPHWCSVARGVIFREGQQGLTLLPRPPSCPPTPPPQAPRMSPHPHSHTPRSLCTPSPPLFFFKILLWHFLSSRK